MQKQNNFKQSGCSLNELAALIANASRRASDVVPPGWFTRKQLQAEWKCGRAVAQYRLRDAIAAGAIQKRNFVVDNGATRRVVPHYAAADKMSAWSQKYQ